MRKRSRPKLLELVVKYKNWLWGVLVLFFVYSFVAGNAGFYTQIRLFFDGQKLKKEITQANHENKILEEKVDSLKNDKNSVRDVSHKNGWAAEDEIIIVIDKDKKKN